MPFIDFSGKKIMVIGASSGIGQATAILLDKLGAKLILVSRNTENLKKTKNMLVNSDDHMVITYDSTEFANSKVLFDRAILDGQKLSGFVYCAGMAKAIPLRVISYNEYCNIFSTNYYGFVNLVQCFAKRKYNDGGSIVGISALNSHYPQKCMTLYSASKAALESTVRTLAIELSDINIRINSVIPGAVDTPMSEGIEKEALGRIISKQLLGMQKPDEIANLIAFLLSNRSSAITGRNIFVDGGMLGQ